MMKKQGFTLAEVLITLTIIGVIATMTLPALMTNTQEQQAKTGLKKGINTLTEIAQMGQAIAGFDYASLYPYPTTIDKNAIDGQTFYGLLASRGPINISYILKVSAPKSRTTSLGLTTYSGYLLPILIPLDPSIIP